MSGGSFPVQEKSADDHIKTCQGCFYGIWEKPEVVAGFMTSMCGERVGCIGTDSHIDTVAENILGVEGFTNLDNNTIQPLK
jgi:hypothetical protein